MVELNFVRAEISAVLELYSKATGKIFVAHPHLEGTLTLIAPFRMSIDEAMQVLASALEVRGFTLMPEGERLAVLVAALSPQKRGGQGKAASLAIPSTW